MDCTLSPLTINSSTVVPMPNSVSVAVTEIWPFSVAIVNASATLVEASTTKLCVSVQTTAPKSLTAL